MKQGNGGHAVVFMQDCTWFLTFEQQLLFLLLETFTFWHDLKKMVFDFYDKYIWLYLLFAY